MKLLQFIAIQAVNQVTNQLFNDPTFKTFKTILTLKT